MAILYTARTKERAQRLVTTRRWHLSLGLFRIKVSNIFNPYIYIYIYYFKVINYYDHKPIFFSLNQIGT